MSVRAKAQAPERIRVSVANAQLAAEPLDLTSVTSVDLEVTRPDGRHVIWSATTLVQTTALLLVEHVFDINDIYNPGDYAIYVVLEVPSGIRRAGPTNLSVDG